MDNFCKIIFNRFFASKDSFLKIGIPLFSEEHFAD